VAAALVEAKLKMTDLTSAVEICSAVHQRYVDFSTHLMESWQKVLAFKKDDKIANASKLRVDLRFYAELISVGVFSLKEGLPLLGQALTFVVGGDKDVHAHVGLVAAFCKHCGDDYAGLAPRKMAELADKYSYEIPDSTLLTPDKQKNVRSLLKDYYQSLCKHVQKVYDELQQLERTNRKILLTKGEVHKERLERAETLKADFGKLMTSAEQLGDALDEEPPELLEAKKNAADEEAEAEMERIEVETSALGQLWDDEEMKSFYENLVDLKAIIPAILYKDSLQRKDSAGSDKTTNKEAKQDGQSAAEEVAKESEAEVLADLEQELTMDEDVKPVNLEEDTEETENQTPSAKMLLEAFLTKLPNCISRDLIDSASIEFCMNLNTKINRKKLTKALFSVQRNRQDLFPFYARMAASLAAVMPDVSEGLALMFKQEFRWQVRKKDQMHLENKLKVKNAKVNLCTISYFLRFACSSASWSSSASSPKARRSSASRCCFSPSLTTTWTWPAR